MSIRHVCFIYCQQPLKAVCSYFGPPGCSCHKMPKGEKLEPGVNIGTSFIYTIYK